MAILINTHEFTGTVIAKAGPYAIKEDMAKSYLYCRGTYMVYNKEKEQDIRFVCFSWGDHKSKITDILPGDEVTVGFTLSGRYTPERKDNLGAPSCWTECVLSKVTILSSEKRELYKNEDRREDEAGKFDTAPQPKFVYPGTEESILVKPPEGTFDDKEDTGLPF